MKSRYLAIILGLSLLLLAAPVPAVAAADSESITDLATTARLDKSDTLEISEQFTYDFGPTTPHELTHTIPLTYYDDQGREFRVTFKLIEVMHNGAPAGAGHVINPSGAHITIPAGSAPHQYTVRYSLSPMVLRGDKTDVFRFSANGGNWTVPIERASLTFRTPDLKPDDLTCETGSGAGTTGNCTLATTDDTVIVQTNSALAPGEKLSLHCTFPLGSFTTYLNPYQPLTAWLPLVLVTAALLIGAGVLIWLLYRRRKSYILKRNDETP